MDDCRVYVCKSNFALNDECTRFKNMKEYNEWCELHKEDFGYYSFQPVCHRRELFDRLVLSFRSKKLNIVDIKQY